MSQQQTAAHMQHTFIKKQGIINLQLLAHFFKKHRVLLVVILACVAAYSVMIIALWPFFLDDGLQETMEQFAAAIPGFDAGSFQMSLGEFVETQWLGVYWLPLAGAVIIVIASKAVAGSVADGSLETVFATPLKRGTYMTTLFVTLLIVSALLSVATIVPLALCGPSFEAELDGKTVLLLLVAAWLLLFVFGCFVTALSAWTRGAGISAALAVALIVVMVALYTVTPMVEALEVLEPLNLLHWWGSAHIIDTGQAHNGLWVWLASVGIVTIALSYVGIYKRDLA